MKLSSVLVNSLLLTVCAWTAAADEEPHLFVSDIFEHAQFEFNAKGGLVNTLGPTILNSPDQLSSPEGFVFVDDQMLLVDQKIGQPIDGFVYVLDKTSDGTSWQFNRVIPADANNPTGGEDHVFAPRELVVKNKLVYVVDAGSSAGIHGRLIAYTLATGKAKFVLNVSKLEAKVQAMGFPDFSFQPTGLVFGPDNKLYVTSRSFADPAAGYIFRFSKHLKWDQSFLISHVSLPELHRPDSPRWSNDFSALVVTSFRTPNNASFEDPDQFIVIPGAEKFSPYHRSKYYTLPVPQPADTTLRNYVQKFVFGPNDFLYYAITLVESAGGAPLEGQATLWKAKFNLKQIKAGQAELVGQPIPIAPVLTLPFNLGFLHTDPATLRYT